MNISTLNNNNKQYGATEDYTYYNKSLYQYKQLFLKAICTLATVRNKIDDETLKKYISDQLIDLKR